MYRLKFPCPSVLVGGVLSASRLGRFTPGERGADSYWIGGRVGGRTGPDDLKKRTFLTLPGLGTSTGRSSRL
jgi:hypothetical protein